MDDKYNDNKLKIKDIIILNNFKDIFPEEVPGIPMKRDIDFTINLIPGVVPTLKAPYQRNIMEITELKSQFQELIDNKYI